MSKFIYDDHWILITGDNRCFWLGCLVDEVNDWLIEQAGPELANSKDVMASDHGWALETVCTDAYNIERYIIFSRSADLLLFRLTWL